MKFIFLLTVWTHGITAPAIEAAFETRASCEAVRPAYERKDAFALCQMMEVRP